MGRVNDCTTRCNRRSREHVPKAPAKGNLFERSGRRRGRSFSPVVISRTIRSMPTAVTNRDEVIERCGRADPKIRALGVRRIALFGSMVRGEADAGSDVDLLVEFEPGGKTFDRFLALSDLLEEVLGRRVDLVTTEALSPYIGPHILAEAEDVVRAA